LEISVEGLHVAGFCRNSFSARPVPSAVIELVQKQFSAVCPCGAVPPGRDRRQTYERRPPSAPPRGLRATRTSKVESVRDLKIWSPPGPGGYKSLIRRLSSRVTVLPSSVARSST